MTWIELVVLPSWGLLRSGAMLHSEVFKNIHIYTYLCIYSYINLYMYIHIYTYKNLGMILTVLVSNLIYLINYICMLSCVWHSPSTLKLYLFRPYFPVNIAFTCPCCTERYLLDIFIVGAVLSHGKRGSSCSRGGLEEYPGNTRVIQAQVCGVKGETGSNPVSFPAIHLGVFQ